MRFILATLVMLLSPVFSAQAEEGFASWYAGKFQGRQTANGEIYDTEKYTAAHKTLPFGTMVRVTNLDNRKSIVVRINDRGPFVEGRIIDLSRVAAQDLGMLSTGIAKVIVEVIQAPVKAAFCEIQVASFKDHDNAKGLGRTLIAKGYSVVYEIAPAGNLRVIIASVPSAKLVEAKALLAGLGFANVIVR